MDATLTTWIIVIVIVLAALVVAALVMRKGRARFQERRHDQAETLRQEAAEKELAVREREAKSMEAEAERLRREASDGTAALREEREQIEEQRRRADKMDPHTGSERDAKHRDATRRDDDASHRRTDPRDRPV